MKLLKLDFNNDDEIKQLFRRFDTTNNGQIDLAEFLQQIKPPMNERRRRAALHVFNSMDINKDGKLTIEDIKVVDTIEENDQSFPICFSWNTRHNWKQSKINQARILIMYAMC